MCIKTTLHLIYVYKTKVYRNPPHTLLHFYEIVAKTLHSECNITTMCEPDRRDTAGTVTNTS